MATAYLGYTRAASLIRLKSNFWSYSLTIDENRLFFFCGDINTISFSLEVIGFMENIVGKYARFYVSKSAKEVEKIVFLRIAVYQKQGGHH